VTANAAKGDAFTALTLVAMYDQLASRIAEKLGVHVYRAVPAYVTVLTAWLADLRALSEYLRGMTDGKVNSVLPSSYWISTFTRFLTYQPTLGLEVYGPPLEARITHLLLTLLLPYLEQRLIDISAGRDSSLVTTGAPPGAPRPSR